VDVGYARVSTKLQDLQIQLDALDRAGCHPIYEEKKSGAKGKDRPVQVEVLRQLERGDTLTVYKLDRLGRSLIDLLAIIEDLDSRGVAFRCLTQPIDTSSPSGRMFLQLLAVFAEFERAMILERTADGLAWREAQGLPHGRPRMFGTVGMGPTAVSPEQAAAEAELVREAGDRARAGEPMNRIVEDWNNRQIPSRNGGTWGVSSLRRVLTNPQVEEIVGAGAYRELARIFDNRENRRQRLGPPTEHLLSGILVCGRPDCGQPMYGTWKGTAEHKEMYYRCKPGNGSGGRFKGCGSTGVSLARADAWAEEAFIAAVVSDDFADALAKRQAELLAGDMTADLLDDMRQEIDELEQVIPTRFAPPNAKERLAQLQRQVREATGRLMAQPELQEMLDLPKSEAKLREAWNGWTVTQRRAWLKRLLESIVVKPATTRGRGSNVETRLDPQWMV
jgi:DNA invertase Pin-like site-specific DNA recombinase